MGKASVDPGELRRFAQDLNRFNNELQTLVSGLHGKMRGLEATWRDQEQHKFWQTQIRKRHETVERCKDAVRQKKLFKDSTGRQQSAVDEEKALSIAQKRLAEAEQKLINTKRHSTKLQKELHLYKGGVQR